MIAVRSLLKKIGQQEILRGVDLKISNGETPAIMGDELSETRGGSADIFRDGAASIIVAQTFNPERFRGQLSALQVSTVQHY
jgi:hypothetical protein